MLTVVQLKLNDLRVALNIIKEVRKQKLELNGIMLKHSKNTKVSCSRFS